MSTNQLNDISKVYLNQIAEETPAERIDRISKANVAKQKEKSDADKAARAKKTAEFQKHKASVISRGGRPVDALDSWHKKQAHKEALELRTEKKEVNVKDTYKTVAAIVDYDRAKKGSEYATYDSEHGKKKEAKKERDYAAWERSKMKRDDPDWKHKKGSTSESLDVNDASLKGVTKKEVKNLQKAAVTGKGKYVKKADQLQDDKKWGYDKKGNSLNPVDIMKKKRKDDDLAGAPNKVKEELEKTGLFSPEELENLA